MDVIITGSTGGIGHCLVNQAIESQSVERIYCQYRNQKKFEDYFGKDNSKVIPERCDLFCDRETSFIIQKLYDNKPKEIACIFTAFSMEPIKRIGTYVVEEIKDNICTNVIDMVIFTNWLLQYKERYEAELKIINIDSGAAYKPLEGWGLYSAAKAYTNMFLKTIQLENKDLKIVSYEPGVVDTPMQEQIRRVDKEIFSQVDMFQEYFDNKKLRSPELVAEDIMRRFIEGWDANDFREGYKI